MITLAETLITGYHKNRIQLLFYYTLFYRNIQNLLCEMQNSPDFVDKHDYRIICYPVISADYTVRSAQCAPLAKELELEFLTNI